MRNGAILFLWTEKHGFLQKMEARFNKMMVNMMDTYLDLDKKQKQSLKEQELLREEMKQLDQVKLLYIYVCREKPMEATLGIKLATKCKVYLQL